MTDPIARGQLWHVSEERIEVFVPRPSPPRSNRPGEPLVWAIDVDGLPRQLLPRDCPRVYARPFGTTSDADAALLGGAAAVMWIEPAWLDVARTTRLFLHALPRDRFVLEDESAGYWVSAEEVEPSAIEVIDDPTAALLAHGVDLRTHDDLRALAERIAASTLDFSIIRLHNAR